MKEILQKIFWDNFSLKLLYLSLDNESVDEWNYKGLDNEDLNYDLMDLVFSEIIKWQTNWEYSEDDVSDIMEEELLNLWYLEKKIEKSFFFFSNEYLEITDKWEKELKKLREEYIKQDKQDLMCPVCWRKMEKIYFWKNEEELIWIKIDKCLEHWMWFWNFEIFEYLLEIKENWVAYYWWNYWLWLATWIAI